MPVTLQAEQLDRLADEKGLMRYDVRADGRHAIISVNVEDDLESDDFTFEAVQATDESFSGDELLAIITAIRNHNDRPQLLYNHLLFNN